MSDRKSLTSDQLKRQTALQKLATQYSILSKKNYIVFKRRWKLTVLQIFSPLLFVFIIFLIDIGFNSSPSLSERREVKRSFNPESIPTISRCVNSPCTTIAYGPAGEPQDTFVSNIATLNGIPSGEIMKFNTTDLMSAYIYANQNKTQGAYYFYTPLVTSGASLQLNYTIAYNDTVTCVKTRVCTNPLKTVVIPMQVAMDAQILSSSFGASVSVNVVKMPRKELVKLDVVGTFGQFFFFLSIMFLFLVFLNLIIGEKETKLRLGLRVMGLLRLPYWFSWFTTAIIMLFGTVLVLIASGAMFQFKFFLLNNFFLYFFLFFLTGMGILMMAFFLSTLIQRTKVATPLGFAFFIIFYLGNLLATNIVYSSSISVPDGLRVFCALLPPVLLAKGLNDLSVAVQGESDNGLSWNQRSSYTDIYPLNTLYWYAAIDILIYAVLLWYFDNVIAGEFGTGEKPWFFLTPSYWTGRTSKDARIVESEKDEVANRIYHEDEDVREERIQMENAASLSGRSLAVRILGLEKFFAEGICCGARKRGYKAVRGISFGINDNELFCLLGPNGAGKSTTFNMLTGVHSISAGAAFVKGFRVGDEMDEIRRIMGVCPQHDILWPDLTSSEHLEIFAAMKGVPRSMRDDEVTKRLKQVDLEGVRNVVSGSYSGGMQRRLSVAIALIGDPKIVYLDEPTTGMDPIARRQVWNMIEAAKAGRSIMLTTHSMEEADILGDRIAIMAKGRIRCLGSSLRLKNRFGAGYRLTFTAHLHEKPIIKNWMARTLPSAVCVGDVGTFLSFQIPRSVAPQLASFFEQIEQQREFTTTDYSLSMSSLEEVFIRISQESRADEAKYLQEKDGVAAPAPTADE
eukprot:ANDGO_01612.mRNA.1 ABC transporter A family member 2